MGLSGTARPISQGALPPRAYLQPSVYLVTPPNFFVLPGIAQALATEEDRLWGEGSSKEAVEVE